MNLFRGTYCSKLCFRMISSWKWKVIPYENVDLFAKCQWFRNISLTAIFERYMVGMHIHLKCEFTKGNALNNIVESISAWNIFEAEHVEHEFCLMYNGKANMPKFLNVFESVRAAGEELKAILTTREPWNWSLWVFFTIKMTPQFE